MLSWLWVRHRFCLWPSACLRSYALHLSVIYMQDSVQEPLDGLGYSAEGRSCLSMQRVWHGVQGPCSNLSDSREEGACMLQRLWSCVRMERIAAEERPCLPLQRLRHGIRQPSREKRARLLRRLQDCIQVGQGGDSHSTKRQACLPLPRVRNELPIPHSRRACPPAEHTLSGSAEKGACMSLQGLRADLQREGLDFGNPTKKRTCLL